MIIRNAFYQLQTDIFRKYRHISLLHLFSLFYFSLHIARFINCQILKVPEFSWLQFWISYLALNHEDTGPGIPTEMTGVRMILTNSTAHISRGCSSLVSDTSLISEFLFSAVIRLLSSVKSSLRQCSGILPGTKAQIPWKSIWYG